MKYQCTKCGKGFEGENTFGQFFRDEIKEPANGVCKECTQAALERAAKSGTDELERQAEKEVKDCIFIQPERRFNGIDI